MVRAAYGNGFDDPALSPVHFIKDDLGFLELFHGPTLAFKDMALSILPYLMKAAQSLLDDHRQRLILTATSGDTGKAAMEGFAGVEGMGVLVFCPDQGVSPMQERQMLTQAEANVRADAVQGNFDDCQREVKRLFEDQELIEELEQKGVALSSANSINIGRLIPQIIYYFDGYRQWVQSGKIRKGEDLNVIVPTGNFGDVLAAQLFVHGFGSSQSLFDPSVRSRRQPIAPSSSPRAPARSPSPRAGRIDKRRPFSGSNLFYCIMSKRPCHSKKMRFILIRS